MKIQIKALCLNGCTYFMAQPRRLHLGGQGSQGVDHLTFELPPDWADKNVTLHIEHQNGTHPAPLLLGEDRTLPVDRRFTDAPTGRWMLAATNGQGYSAYSQPGSYDTYSVLSLKGEETEPSPTLYEQFIAQVLESALQAQQAADQAAQSETEAGAAALSAEQSAQAAGIRSEAAEASAQRAEEAARRAEGYFPEGGTVISVNGQGGAVWLEAQDVGALPCPEAAAPGQLLRVLEADPVSGQVTVEAVEETALTSFVRSTDRPTADTPGPIRLGEGGGLALTAAGVLETASATPQQLDAFTDLHAPVTPAVLPYGVKKALTGGAAGASWTGEDQAAACGTLGAAAATALETLIARVQTLEGQLSQLPAATTAPVGSVAYFAGKAAPEGYLLCDGSLVNRKTYAALFAVIGTTYGEGNGSTTFALPDLRDRVAWGSTTPGTALAAGLPNITGQIFTIYAMVPWNNGAFYGHTTLKSYYPGFDGVYEGTVPSSDAISFLCNDFAASNCSPLYGGSQTVQPPALTLLPCIKY